MNEPRRHIDQPTNDPMLMFVESIDHRLELFNTKLDQFIKIAVTKQDCATCNGRITANNKNLVDKRVFLGMCIATAFVTTTLVAMVGVAIKFL